MIPIAVQVKDQTLYFNPVMFAADELEKDRLVIFTVEDNAVSFHQLDDDLKSLRVTEHQVFKAAVRHGQLGLVKVVDIRPDRFIFDNASKEFMVFWLEGGAVKRVDFTPRKEILSLLEKEKKSCNSK